MVQVITVIMEVIIIIGMETIITIITITMVGEEVMRILQMATDMVLEMAPEVQTILLTEEALTQHPEHEAQIIITPEQILQTILLGPILTIQQELTLLHNQQEVVVMNYRLVPTLQVLITTLDHLLMVGEVIAEEDLHQVEEEDKKT